MKSENIFEFESLPKVDGSALISSKKLILFVRGMEYIGFQATHLSKAGKIIQEMKRENARIFFGFTSNMVSSGLRELFADVVRKKLIDIIITGAGSIEEDFIKSFKPFLLGDFNVSDEQLHKAGVNRIGNIFVPNDRYEMLEEKIKPILEELYERNKNVSPSELVFEMGKFLKDKNSILFWARRNNIPIFCPAITDGALGLQIYFFKQKHKDFSIDVTADMKRLIEITLNAEKTGAIILGGGFAKHHILGVNLLRGGLDYAVYICTAIEGDGSLSGARPKEAKSWGKLKETGNHIFVECDATIAFPLIKGFLEER